MFKYLFVLMLLVILYFCLESYQLEKKESFKDDTNLFFKPLENIFLDKSYMDYDLNKVEKKPEFSTLSQIAYNSYIDSDIVSTKIICSNYNNQGDCWDNNHCQWVNKLGGNSYCEIAPKWLL